MIDCKKTESGSDPASRSYVVLEYILIPKYKIFTATPELRFRRVMKEGGFGRTSV